MPLQPWSEQWGLPVPFQGQDVLYRVMATCHMVQSEQPDSPGKLLHPLLTFPGGSSFKPWILFKNTLGQVFVEKQPLLVGAATQAGDGAGDAVQGCWTFPAPQAAAPGAGGEQLNFRAPSLQQHVGTSHHLASEVLVRAGSPTRTWHGMI